MLRVLAFLLWIAACILGAISGAILGICAELHWPLSEANFYHTIRWGVGVGLSGGGVTALVLLMVPRQKLWRVGSIGACVTTVVSCASMWWAVVSSLG